MSKPPHRRPNAWTPFLRRFTDERTLDLHNTEKLQRTVLHRWRKTVWASEKALETTAERFLERLGKEVAVPNHLVEKLFKDTIRELLSRETAIFGSKELEQPAASLPLPQRVYLRRVLRTQEYFLDNEERVTNLLAEGIVASLSSIASSLPPIEEAQSLLTVPVADVLGKPPAEIVERLFASLTEDKYMHAGLFSSVTRTLYVNVCRANGVEPFTEHKPLKPATDLKVPEDEVIATFLANTPFYHLLQMRVPFAIPRAAWRAHCAMFAPSDHGKTQSMQCIIADFLSQPDPPGLFVMDSMGAMLKKIERLQVFQDRLKGRLVVLNPSGPNPPRMNFFKLSGGSEAQKNELRFYLFKALDQSLTARQKTTVIFLSQLMQKIGGTLDDLRAVCLEKKPAHEAAIRSLPAVTQDFLLNVFYKPDTLMTQTKQQIAQRLFTLAATPIYQMFSARDNDFDAFACMQQKKIVLINTDRHALGDDGSALFGRFMLGQFLAAAFARAPLPEDKRPLAIFMVDEAKAYLDEQAEKFLSDARQFWLGLFLATQYVGQLEDGVRKAVYGNTSIKFIGPVEYGDRVSLGREMNCTPEFIAGMRAYDKSHTEWAVHVRTSNLTPSAIKLTVPFGVLEAMPTKQVSRQPPPSKQDHHAREPEAPGPAQAPTDSTPEPRKGPDSARGIKPGKKW